MPCRQNQQSPSTPPIQETPTRVPIGNSARGSINHLADDLMAGDEARLNGRQVAFDDVEIGAADATGDDFDKDVPGLGFRPWEILYRKPMS